jgi:hypothetical protein
VNDIGACTNVVTNPDATAYATRDDIVSLVRLLLPRGSDGEALREVPVGSTSGNGFLDEPPICVHRAAHQIAALAEIGDLNEDDWPELYEHPGELIEEDDADEDRDAAQEIVTLLTKAYGL